MRSAKVKFEITVVYETTVEEYDEDGEYTLEDEIRLKQEYLETQGEDLLDALMDAELVKVEIIEQEEIFEPKPPLNFDI